MTCDLDSASQNAAVDRQQDSRPGDGRFKGVFGNNALFYVPTRCPGAGQPVCFAVGPCEAELTGPTFSPDGRTLAFTVLGANAILVYLCTAFVSFGGLAEVVFARALERERLSPLLVPLIGVCLQWCVFYALYRRRIFLRV